MGKQKKMQETDETVQGTTRNQTESKKNTKLIVGKQKNQYLCYYVPI